LKNRSADDGERPYAVRDVDLNDEKQRQQISPPPSFLPQVDSDLFSEIVTHVTAVVTDVATIPTQIAAVSSQVSSIGPDITPVVHSVDFVMAQITPILANIPTQCKRRAQHCKAQHRNDSSSHIASSGWAYPGPELQTRKQRRSCWLVIAHADDALVAP
jgi:hypothetical protein